MHKWLLVAAGFGVLWVISNVLLGAASSASGLPEADGTYPVQAQSIKYDGSAYRFVWLDAHNTSHSARSSRVQLQQNDATFLEMKDAQPILHLSPEEPVTVSGRDDRGSFTSTWFPFLAGYALGGGFSTGPPVSVDRSGPAYRYPPVESITRDSTAYGSTASARRETLDFNKTTPAINAVGGKNSGTGSGAAATNKASGSSVQSGQSGGTGAGTAATSKSSDRPAISGQAGGTGAGAAATSKTAPKIGGKPSSGFSGGGKPSLSFGGRRR